MTRYLLALLFALTAFAQEDATSTDLLTWDHDGRWVTPHFEIHASRNAGFTPSSATQVGSVPVPLGIEIPPTGFWEWPLDNMQSGGPWFFTVLALPNTDMTNEWHGLLKPGKPVNVRKK